MDEDTTAAAWAQQEQDEQLQEILRADPAYLEWLESLNNQDMNNYEIRSESNG